MLYKLFIYKDTQRNVMHHHASEIISGTRIKVTMLRVSKLVCARNK